jgi:trehalose-phosphatase
MELGHKPSSNYALSSSPRLQSASAIRQISEDSRRSDSPKRVPRHLFGAWGEVERRMRSAGRLALFLDFDGTMTPIAALPDQVQLSPRIREQLKSIAQKNVTVGVVSGRKLADLRARVAVSGIWYVGTHGYFFRRSGSTTETLLNPTEKKEMAAVLRRLAREIGNVPGIFLESKQATIAIHYRHVSRPGYQKIFLALCRLLQDRPQLHLLPGKKVWELFPNAFVNKWTTIQHILELEPGEPESRWLVIFLGDDAIDERVFSQMKGISVVVGRHRRTAADFYLDSPGEIGKFLEKFLESMK